MIRNPEVQRLSPTLLRAIADPNVAGKKALNMMLSTTFVNTVDAASLALIVPVVHRGLRDRQIFHSFGSNDFANATSNSNLVPLRRSGDTKKRAARIVGNMCTLINQPQVATFPYQKPVFLHLPSRASICDLVHSPVLSCISYQTGNLSESDAFMARQQKFELDCTQYLGTLRASGPAALKCEY